MASLAAESKNNGGGVSLKGSSAESCDQELIGRSALADHDPELFAMIQNEKKRQWMGLELIASEVRRLRSVRGEGGGGGRTVFVPLRDERSRL
jgi:hypothetical protein